MDAIQTVELTKSFSTTFFKGREKALDSLSLTIGEHEVFGFLGRNGAGKTTTIKILCSLLKPSAGEAYVFGLPARSRQARRLIGYLPENPYFYEYLTPRETVEFYGRLHGLNAAERTAEWKKLAEQLDLGAIADQRVRGFSKGMRQRLGFAVALVGDPAVLILDEPMSGLDPLGRRAIRELILEQARQKKTIFFSSHVLGDVEQICDRVAVLVRGSLRAEGRLDALLSRRINMVEVIIEGLPDGRADGFAKQALSSRDSEVGSHFLMPGLDEANDLTRRAYEAGGRLVEFTPVKETLEDYFMRNQEAEEVVRV